MIRSSKYCLLACYIFLVQIGGTASLLLRQASRSHGNSSQAIEGEHAEEQLSEPRIFFLFLTRDGSITLSDLWSAFFEGQPTHKYRIFMHCSDPTSCKKHPKLEATNVPTVKSTYCVDLVSPMVQLLAYATKESYNSNDKFIFLSETTLPVKPFWHIYRTLVKEPSSDLCIMRSAAWVQFPLTQGLESLVVKHSQWVVLNREHANTMVQDFQRVTKNMGRQHFTLPVYDTNRNGPYGIIKNSAGDQYMPLCFDEFAIFATLYGALVKKGLSWQKVDLQNFGGGPLLFPNGDVQGVCRTFAFHDEESFQGSKLLKEISRDPFSKIECGNKANAFPDCKGSHPAEFTELSDRGVAALRNSRYLFARKFTKKVMTLDQFRRIILETSPIQIVGTSPMQAVREMLNR